MSLKYEPASEPLQGHDVTGQVDHEKEARRKKPSKNYKVELWKLSRGQVIIIIIIIIIIILSFLLFY